MTASMSTCPKQYLYFGFPARSGASIRSWFRSDLESAMAKLDPSEMDGVIRRLILLGAPKASSQEKSL